MRAGACYMYTSWKPAHTYRNSRSLTFEHAQVQRSEPPLRAPGTSQLEGCNAAAREVPER